VGPAAKKKHGKIKRAEDSVLAAGAGAEIYRLRLYVAGETPRSLTAFANLKRICSVYLPGRYRIEVVDLLKNPQRAREDEIFAIPTLVRDLPAARKRIVGDLSNTERVLAGLQLV
jgi:circadian clock protein KaiB